MISTVTIEGFKSFGSPATTVALEPLNFIVGANACGKTNFVSALKFLHLSLLHGLDHTVNNEFNGCREVRNRVLRETNESRPCSIAVRLKDLKLQFETPEHRKFEMLSAFYELKVDLRSDDSNPIVGSETFRAELIGQDGTRSTYTLDRDATKLKISDPTNSSVQEKDIPSQESAKLALANAYFGLPALWFRELVSSWTFFNINSESARSSVREIPGIELGSRGENLAAVLHEIEKSNGQACWNTILGALRGAIPRIKDIKPVRTEVEGKWTFQIVEDRIRALTPFSISDGTIRLLTLLVAACWSARKSSLLVIEEPENNLHPHLCEQLVAMFRAVSQDHQVIITTHSANFLDYLQPEELLLCERDDETTFTRLIRASDKENIDIFRRRYTIGELWLQGELGGIPK
jgi:predicted ATPase